MNEREPTERWKATEQTDSRRTTTRWRWPTTTTPAVSTTRLQGVHDTPHQVTSKPILRGQHATGTNVQKKGTGSDTYSYQTVSVR
jgi:hypothetical protein